MENVRLEMKKIDKPDEFADLSSFSCLPDDILLQIFNRLIDLKTLCRCKLVSIRFNHIVQQVNAISVTIPFDSNSSGDPSERDRPLYLFKCETFSAFKSLCIEMPPIHRAEYNDFLFKWKLFGNKADSFLFLSPNSVCDTKENVQDEVEQEEENVKLSKKKCLIAENCLVGALSIRFTISSYMTWFPLLENVTITDTSKRGKVSLCGEIFPNHKNCLRSLTKFAEMCNSDVENGSFNRVRRCYVPLLKLPVSGYMMKGVTLALFETNDLPGDDCFTNINLNDFEDKEEAAYTEAMMEIFKKNRERIFA